LPVFFSSQKIVSKFLSFLLASRVSTDVFGIDRIRPHRLSPANATKKSFAAETRKRKTPSHSLTAVKSGKTVSYLSSSALKSSFVSSSYLS
jgi:hypothetical protein